MHNISYFFRFPGLTWYIEQKPKEVKPLCDHTTGLCHLCESARENYRTMIRTMKRLCVCGTRMCPNFECFCPFQENDEEATGPCDCSPCDCEDCKKCKVISHYVYFTSEKRFITLRHKIQGSKYFQIIEIFLKNTC